ncbi:GNAT family N-acetyltransferase [Sinorhizobium meliloti]|uniref:GNAT family N-acetyltransferase n=1 Tax=Rhizobium meliloti TaxID=382 RepID=UPI0013E39896|nr:GNAT family N-acetyltransferase [Sinorhizobium meliloti]MDW9868753.1 GNAT family N-acetyltransferase [Sinorhizobium meliloti]MDX0060992.1 GNAT family N-acetyltransferase [Sinorhizobium meliloti]
MARFKKRVLRQADQRTAKGVYRIRFYEHYGHSPAWQSVPPQMAHLGFAPQPDLPPTFADSCVVAIDEDGNVLGFIAYDCGEKSWDITLSYVDLENRPKNIQTSLLTALVNKAQEKGVPVNFFTHVNNLAAHNLGEMRMPEYLVEPFDTGLDGLESMQAFINEKAAEGYELHQVIEGSACQWVLIFRRNSAGS